MAGIFGSKNKCEYNCAGKNGCKWKSAAKEDRMVTTEKFREYVVKRKPEMMAREGICPECNKPGFMGLFVDENGIHMGTCLCKWCWAIWKYFYAARRHWN